MNIRPLMSIQTGAAAESRSSRGTNLLILFFIWKHSTRRQDASLWGVTLPRLRPSKRRGRYSWHSEECGANLHITTNKRWSPLPLVRWAVQSCSVARCVFRPK